ncbi:titan9 [Zea mays]|uniref:Titan9 n=1 Tax=Zea mays TaxID=4577 RepID=K7UNZ8_MAIZE|nr:titan9 [Zea mays]
MEQLDYKFHEKYTALKKRKLLDEGLERKREAELNELYDAMKDWVSELRKDNAELNEKLVEKQDELEKARQEFLEDIRTRDAEILKLKQLLDEKAEKNNSAATGFPCLAPEAVLENSTPLSPKRKTPFSHGKVKRVQLSEDVHHSSPAEEKSE